eukprot:gene22672-23900_t
MPTSVSTGASNLSRCMVQPLLGLPNLRRSCGAGFNARHSLRSPHRLFGR